jgi:hypothetical protein
MPRWDELGLDPEENQTASIEERVYAAVHERGSGAVEADG